MITEYRNKLFATNASHRSVARSNMREEQDPGLSSGSATNARRKLNGIFRSHTRAACAARRRNFRRRTGRVAGRRCFSGRNRGKIRRLTQYKAQCWPSHVRNGARAARVLRLRAPTKESRRNNLHQSAPGAVLQKYMMFGNLQ